MSHITFFGHILDPEQIIGVSALYKIQNYNTLVTKLKFDIYCKSVVIPIESGEFVPIGDMIEKLKDFQREYEDFKLLVIRLLTGSDHQ